MFLGKLALPEGEDKQCTPPGIQRDVTLGHLRRKAALEIALAEFGGSKQGAVDRERQAQGDSYQPGLAGRKRAMTLSTLIKNGGITSAMTATPAKPETHQSDNLVTVAPVAVARQPEPLPEVSPEMAEFVAIDVDTVFTSYCLR